MKRVQHSNSKTPENKTNGKFPVKRLIVPILFAFIFMVSLCIFVTLLSDNAEASFGLSIWVEPPSTKDMDTSTTPQSVFFTINVKNEGTSEENVNLSISFDLPQKETEGWKVTPKTFTVNSLGSGSVDSVIVLVEAPFNIQNATAGSFAQLTVEGYVIESPGITSSDSFTAKVKQIYKTTIEIIGQDSKNVDQGQSIQYDLIINNTGNGEDTIGLSASGLPVGWSASFSPIKKQIPMGGSFTSKMTLTLPTQVKSSTYAVGVVATSEGNPSKSDETSTFTSVNKKYQLSIDIKPLPSQTGLPGENVIYNITVKNLGNTDDLVDAKFIKKGGLTWDVFLDQGAQLINYQSSAAWTMTVTVHPDAKSWEKGNVDFNVTSSNPSGYAQKGTLTRVASVYDVGVYIPQNTKVADPGDTVSYNVEITNRGNTNDTIRISASGPFTADPSPNQLFDLQPDSPTFITLNVTVPTDALSGIHQITVTAESQGDTSKTSFDVASVDVNPFYDVDLQSLGGEYKSGIPGGSPVTYQLRVVNDGTDEDTFDLSRGGQKPNWAALSETTVTIPAQSYAIVDITVNIPSNEPINVWYFNITGTSLGNSSRQDMQPYQIEVEQTFDVTLSSTKASKSVPAGGSIIYYIDVKNSGSGLDDFTIRTWADDGEVRTWASTSHQSIKLNSGQNITVEMYVDVSENALPGSYSIQFNCTSVNDSTLKVIYVTQTQVTDKYDVVIAGAKERSKEAPEDVNVTYLLTVFNFGTSSDKFEISVSGDRTGWVALSNDLITLGPNGQYNLSVTVNIQDANDPAIADGKHNIKVTVTSRDDPSFPKSSDFVWLNTSLTETRDASLNPEQDVFNADPEDVVFFKVSLTNTGSTTDTFELDDDGAYKAWGTILNPTVTLMKDESVNITYRVDVSKDITRNKSPVELFLRAKSLGANSIVENITLQININQTFGVQLFSVQSEQTGDPGKWIVFQIEIKNEGNDVDDIILSHKGNELGVWNMSVTRLKPDESIFANYNITIDADHDINDINIVLNASSNGNNKVYTTLPITIHVNPKYEVKLVANGPNTKDIKGGENRTFSLGITNRGTDIDVFDLEAKGPQQSWAVINPADPTNTTVWVQKGQTVYITILVSVPEGEDVQKYDIIINVTSQNDAAVTAEYTFFANVEATYDVFIYPGNPHDKVKAGETALYTVFVENKGNDDDQFNFFETGLPAGWGITITPSSLNVPAGSTDSVTISVVTSSGSASGLYEFNITATSINDATKESSTKLITEVEQRYNLIISSPTSTKSVDVNNYVIYNVDIKNDGNGEDTFEVKISGTYSHWASLYFNATEQGDIIHINPPPGGSLSVKLNVSIPSRTEWEVNSPSSITITVEAKSIEDPDSPPAKTKDFITNINNIYQVSMSTTSNSRAGVPKDTVSFTITVKNDGTVSDTFNLEIEQFYTLIPGITIGVWDDENPSPFSSSQVGPLNPGVSQSVTMDITIPSPVDLSEVPTGNYYIVVKTTSQGKSTISTNKTFTVKVQQLYSAWITDSVSPKSVDVGSYVEYQLQVQNKGNKLDTLTFEKVDDPAIPGTAAWGKIYYQGSVITSITLNASESRFVTFNVSIPTRGNLPTPEPTSVDITVKVLPSEPGATGAIEDEIVVTTNINAIYTFDLTSMSPNNKKEADAGDLTPFTLQVQNTGTVADSYTFRVSNFDESKFSISSINNVNNLNPDGYGTTVVSITIDDETELGSYIIEITVESLNSASVKHSINLTLDIVGPVYIFNFNSPSSIKDGEPGDQVEYTIQVRNAGTTTDSYDFRVTNIDEDIFTVSTINSISNLDEDSYDTTPVTVSITNAMNKAVAGTYTIEITANSVSDPAVVRVLNLTVKITPLADVEITPSSQSDKGEPGDVVDYFVKIINKGNAVDNFDLTLSAGNKEWGEIWSRDGTQRVNTVTLNESESTSGDYFIEVILRVTIPSTGETQAGTSYPITIKATSRNTEGVEDTGQVSTQVEDFVDLLLEYSGSGDASRDYDPNKKAPKFSFRVTNNGNQDEDSIEIRVDDINSDWDFSPTLLADSLEPGGASTFSIEFNIPADEAVGEYEMEVYVVSSVDPTVQSESVFITVNITKPDLSVSDVSGLDDEDYLMGRVGNAVTITAQIQNSGTTEARNVQVKLYEENTVRGTKTISSIPEGETKNVDFRWTVVAEEVELKVEITPLEEIDDGNNEFPPIFLDLRPDLSFDGEEVNFSKANPAPGDKITLTAFIKNSGGDAENVVIKFYDGTKIIGTDEIDIDHDEVGEAQVEWTVPDKEGESRTIKAEIDASGAIGEGEESSKSVKIESEDVTGDFLSMSGIIMLIVGFLIGAILAFIAGRSSGRSAGGGPQGPAGMTGPTFGAFEKDMGEGTDKKAMKGPAGAAPAPFERMEEEGAGEEEEAAKPKEAARVRCPKCGRVMEVTSTQRPLQIPCECGTTLMLKK